MLIDWFTVGAQLLNFLVLVWLMKHFLYQPILTAIDAREDRIATQIADTEKKETEATRERDDFRQKNEAFDEERATMITKATAEAETEKQRLLDEARKAAESLSTKRQEAMQNASHHLSQSITRRTQDEVFAISRKALLDLATTSLEIQMCDMFIRRLRKMDETTKVSLREALTSQTEPSLVRSALALSEECRTNIQTAINETFSADVPLRFETSPDIISGIELSTQGQKVSWSIAEYLISLEKSVGELLKEKDKAKSK